MERRLRSLSLTLAVELHPGDIVSHTLHLPARQRWFHHGQVGFPTSARESGRNVPLYTPRIGDSKNLKREKAVQVGTIRCAIKTSINSFKQKSFPSFQVTYQHMFSQPAFIFSNARGDTERKTLLTQEGIPAVATPERQDLPAIREMRDQHLVWITWPLVYQRRWETGEKKIIQ